MALPETQKMKTKGTFHGKEGNRNQPYKQQKRLNKYKRKWVPEHKVFDGSIAEGQGFAFKRKEKVKHEYNKLLRKERRKNAEVKTQYKEEFPEHLRHLYEAEAEQLMNEAKINRINRTKARMGGGGGAVEEKAAPMEVNEASPTSTEPAADAGICTNQTDSSAQLPSATGDLENDSLPVSNRSKKKMLRKTSYQKTKEEFESIKIKKQKKKEEFLKNKQQKEEAIKKYKQKKSETFQMLSKKTKKGQPNLNLQMDYLLQKIQEANRK
ncbi:thyroid transcription factor 1-associated protein 26 homolog [Esox lucius]|uniref:Thyroid transcription factor 1-associated protein 26 homolog n=1 Tax=Esox lucius TaxID=8010 RepID=C1BX24_ESOLU|nr:thyroid transcription factor 1-associated protein 26 homolog [Esox lucius]ACO13577.1 Thyroid transcription factor 1-associated protein 26 homolog [Esox lucius]